MLWHSSRGRRLNGQKFVRQAPIGTYLADFVCRSHSVVVEIDGATYGTQLARANDELRSAFLGSQGYRVFRTDNQDVFQNLDGVLSSLLALVLELKSVNDEA